MHSTLYSLDGGDVSESSSLLHRSDSLYSLSQFKPPKDRSLVLRTFTIMRIVSLPSVLAAIVALAWCLALTYTDMPQAAATIDSTLWTFVGTALAFLLALRGNANYERFTTCYRRLTSVCALSLHSAEYLSSQILRSSFLDGSRPLMGKLSADEAKNLRKKCKVYVPTTVDGSQVLDGVTVVAVNGRLEEQLVVNVIADIGSLLAMLPLAVRSSHQSFHASYARFRPPRSLRISAGLQQELALYDCSLDCIRHAMVRRVCVLIEAGVYQPSTAQVAFRTVSQLVDHIGQLSGARRTFMPFAHRDLLALLLTVYCICIPYIMFPSLQWWVILLNGFLGAVLGGVIEVAAAVRDAIFVDGKEERIMGIQSRCWVEETARRIVSIFAQLDDEIATISA
eukprot:ANDGO_05522.mRNA.1 hypothetical protein